MPLHGEMAESQPVRPIREERILAIGIDQGAIDPDKPAPQGGVGARNARQEPKLSSQRDRRRAAQDKADDEKPEPNSTVLRKQRSRESEDALLFISYSCRMPCSEPGVCDRIASAFQQQKAIANIQDRRRQASMGL